MKKNRVLLLLALLLLLLATTQRADKKAGSVTLISRDTVPVSWQLLENLKLASRMLTKHDERAFDLYLLLLRKFDGIPGEKIVLDYDKTAASLGLRDTMTRTAYRRQITKSARKLEETYNLIKFEPWYAKDAAVTLLNYNNSRKPYSMPKEWYFQVPDNFWGYEWNKKLSMRAKFCYLINLAYVSISDAAPWWFSSREVLAKRFNISKWVISKGMGELRSLNLIDVSYGIPESGSYKPTLAKSYKVLPLYDPDWLESEWDRLELTYGQKSLSRAREYAKIVFKENVPETVEEIIILTNALGEESIEKAFAIVAKKGIDNPKRCYAYVKGILNNLQK